MPVLFPFIKKKKKKKKKINSLNTFKNHLKAFLFSRAYNQSGLTV